MTLEGRAAVITGGGGGIGRATGVAMGRAGARIMLVDRDAARLGEAAAAVAETGAEVRVRTADVAASADVQGYVADAVDAFGTIDVLFNNAGIIGPVGALADYDEDAFDRIMAINVRGVFLGLKHVIPAMRAAGGTIVNTASQAGIRGVAGLSAYSASKHAVVGLSRGAALEEAPAIRVNCLAPGPTDTRMMADIEQTVRDQGGDPSGFVDRIPAGRYGRPEEIAAAAVWLLADAPDFLTGAVVPVDGAMTTP
jgi:NAD(P)-dependent dehydrogenase (short-subunit alcohol dehydrogenase family)